METAKRVLCALCVLGALCVSIRAFGEEKPITITISSTKGAVLLSSVFRLLSSDFPAGTGETASLFFVFRGCIGFEVEPIMTAISQWNGQRAGGV